MSEFVRYSPVRNEAFARRLLAYTVWFYGRCDFVSSPAAAIFEEMARFGFNAPHRVVSNPIDLDAFRPRAGRRALKKKFGLSGRVLLYAGRLAEEKRVDLTIASAAALRNEFPDLEVAIVGKGAAEPELRALAASLGIEKAVKFFGFIPDHRTLSDLYNASDIFVMMSTAETQSIVAMQAFACGIPVIAARAWGLKEYVTERNGILVAPGDGGELTRRIRYLLAHPEKAKTLGKGGLRSVARMSTATVADTWERIYKDVAAHYNTKR
jgi:glycosyltransferase involved in cell wall biosynthesis